MTATTARRLRKAGQRVTSQRLAVAAALAASPRQVTAQELWEQMRPSRPALGRATVFRTLEALSEAGLARRLEREGHVYAYVACRPAHHHHLACRVCGTVEEIGEELVPRSAVAHGRTSASRSRTRGWTSTACAAPARRPAWRRERGELPA